MVARNVTSKCLYVPIKQLWASCNSQKKLFSVPRNMISDISVVPELNGNIDNGCYINWWDKIEYDIFKN